MAAKPKTTPEKSGNFFAVVGSDEGLVREKAPLRLVIFLRRCLRGWGMLTARWRLRPSFIIVGAQRCGTTTLYRVLSEHPALARPTIAVDSRGFLRDFDWSSLSVNHHRWICTS